MIRAIALGYSRVGRTAQSDCPVMAEHLGTWGRENACVSHRSRRSTVGTRVEDRSPVTEAVTTHIPRYPDSRGGAGTSSRFGGRP